MKTLAAVVVVFPFLCFAQIQDSIKIKYVNTFLDVKKLGVFYNAFNFEGTLIIVKDTISFRNAETTSTTYLNAWIQRNEVARETENVFLLDSALNHLTLNGYFKLDEMGFKMGYRHFPGYTGVLIGGHIYLKEPEKDGGNRMGQTWTLLATIYECTNDHSGSPHSGTDREKLKNDYGCTKFQAKVL